MWQTSCHEKICTNQLPGASSDTASSMAESNSDKTQRKCWNLSSRTDSDFFSRAMEVEHSLKVEKLKLEIDFVRKQKEILQMQHSLLHDQQKLVKKQQELLIIEHKAKMTRQSDEASGIL